MRFHGRQLRRSLVLALLLALLAPAAPAQAQITGVELEVRQEDVGIAGHVRFGQWTPIRLTLRNPAGDPRDVLCRWLIEDADGDEIVLQRNVTIDANEQHVWLYAVPRVNQRADRPWKIQVLDEDTGEPLASANVQVRPDHLLGDDETAIGLMTTKSLGLELQTTRDTRHKAVRLVRGLTLDQLPDRWYGMSSMQAIIWTRDGGVPYDDQLHDNTRLALRQWVRRGGHLIVVLPSPGQSLNDGWNLDAILSDLLPVDADDMRPMFDEAPPDWLFTMMPEQPPTLQLTAFDVDADDRATVLLRDEFDNALVVAGRYGFGRVTLVGVDLADVKLSRLGLPAPAGRFPMWNTIFGWQNPAFPRAYLEAERQASPPRISRLNMRKDVVLDRFVPSQIAMRETAAPAVTWGGGWMMHPRISSIAHFSVVDVDGRTGQVRTQSWLSLYLSRFASAHVKLESADNGVHNTLASPGLPQATPEAGFLDPRTYDPPMDAGAPDAMHVPFRGTAKQLQLDYFGALDDEMAGVTHKWIMPQGEPRLERNWPVGRLSHNLPGTLRNVLVVYCPGGGDPPWVWPQDDWAPQSTLELATNRNQATRLVQPRRQFPADRNWSAEGFLGELINRKTGHTFASDDDPARLRVADNVLVQSVEMLTFYSMLPPPNFRQMPGLAGMSEQPVMYQRQIGRTLDLSHLTAEPRLIVIGFLANAPLPAPLTVDGEAVPAEGWTVVRWVYDL